MCVFFKLFLHTLLCCQHFENVTHLFIVLHQTQGRENPGGHRRQKLLISKVHILLDLCHFQWGLSTQLVIRH